MGIFDLLRKVADSGDDNNEEEERGPFCDNCGRSLRGSVYTAPWENGSNSDGYWKCRHCRAVTFDWED